jgi:hypothetical protein
VLQVDPAGARSPIGNVEKQPRGFETILATCCGWRALNALAPSPEANSQTQGSVGEAGWIEIVDLP